MIQILNIKNIKLKIKSKRNMIFIKYYYLDMNYKITTKRKIRFKKYNLEAIYIKKFQI